jgi:N-acetylmuramoyl-L-alanine amidase
MNLQVTACPSPNFGARPTGTRIDLVVLHYTGMKSAKDALDRLCDPEAEVSAHYLIDENGKVYRLVQETDRAWHAGASYWQGATNINDRSIGIEIVNPGHEFGYRPFPEMQMTSVEVLLADILARYDIPPDRVVGHSDIAPERKQDPGELFDWKRLADKDLSVWPPEAAELPADEEIITLLQAIGYDPDASLEAKLTAFQRRFVPDNVSGGLNPKTARAIVSIASITT